MAVPKIGNSTVLKRSPLTAGRYGSGPLRVPVAMVEACRTASLLIGGPNLKRLGVTSALRGEGRTSVALAMASIQRVDFGRSVVLVDMDFENPTLARRHELEPAPGLAEVVRGEVDLEQVLQPVFEGVQLISTGAISGTASRTVTELARSGLLTEIASRGDVVIADMPPLLGGGPGATAAAAFNDLLLVVRAGVTPVARVKEATADLHVTPGVLLNGASSSLPRWLRRLAGR